MSVCVSLSIKFQKQLSKKMLTSTYNKKVNISIISNFLHGMQEQSMYSTDKPGLV